MWGMEKDRNTQTPTDRTLNVTLCLTQRVTPPYPGQQVCLKVSLTKAYREDMLYEYVLWNLGGLCEGLLQ